MSQLIHVSIWEQKDNNYVTEEELGHATSTLIVQQLALASLIYLGCFDEDSSNVNLSFVASSVILMLAKCVPNVNHSAICSAVMAFLIMFPELFYSNQNFTSCTVEMSDDGDPAQSHMHHEGENIVISPPGGCLQNAVRKS